MKQDTTVFTMESPMCKVPGETYKEMETAE